MSSAVAARRRRVRRHVWCVGGLFNHQERVKKSIFNLFLTPGVIPNRFALKFYDGGSYFHNFWWHGMKMLIFPYFLFSKYV